MTSKTHLVHVLTITVAYPFARAELACVRAAIEQAWSGDGRAALVVYLCGPARAPDAAQVTTTASADPETRFAFDTLVADLEASATPVVAALEGALVGLPLELSLACSARVALDSAMLGLPDVQHGLIAGCGSTQRVARLLGVGPAWEWLHNAVAVPARQLLAGKLLAKVVENDVAGSARALAKSLHADALARARPPRASDLRPEAAATEATVFGLRSRLSARQRLQTVFGALLDALEGAAVDFTSACMREAQILHTLRLAPQARALRYVADAEQRASTMAPQAGVAPRPIGHLAIIGAGTMGTGIAIAALDSGCRVTLLERDQEALRLGSRRVSEHYQGRARAGRIKTATAAACEARLQPSTDWTTLADADLVIEAVFEDLEVKRAVFQHMDTHARPGAILATNTSYLDINTLAAHTERPQDVLGLHFFSPANVMKLLEVVRTGSTAPDVVATGMALARQLGKVPVLSGQSFGFIGNRIYNAYRRQCECMLEDGAWPEDVDAALEGFGFAMGPFAVADLSGLDIAWRMRRAQAASRDPRERFVPILDHLCERGRLGRKTQAGYYTYAEGKRSKVSDADVRTIITQASAARGLTRRKLEATEILQRALMAMANEAALVVAEGVAARATDVDVVLVLGYGFPRWEGGPLYWASHQNPGVLAAALQALGQSMGHGFRAAALDALIPSTPTGSPPTFE